MEPSDAETASVPSAEAACSDAGPADGATDLTAAAALVSDADRAAISALLVPQYSGMLTLLRPEASAPQRSLRPGKASMVGRRFEFTPTSDRSSSSAIQGFLIEFEAAEFWDEQVGLLLTVLVDNPGKDDMRVKVHFCCSRSEQLAWLRCCEVSLALDPLLLKMCSPETVTLGEILGEGAFGCVFKAHAKQPGGEITVAAKTLRRSHADQEEQVDFILEGVIQAQLCHPNLPLLYGVTCLAIPPNSAEPSLCLLTEYMAYGDLKRRLHVVGRDGGVRGAREALTNEEFVQIASGIVAGLMYLHTNNIVHRDLKPENVMLRDSVTPKIIDFGQSRRVNSRTMTANTRGSLLWRAPEMVDETRSAEYGCQVDIYSLGIVLWEMFTRQEPYSNVKTTWDILAGVCDGTLRPPLEGVPPRLQFIIKWCWVGEPQGRPTASECHTLLQDPLLFVPLENLETLASASVWTPAAQDAAAAPPAAAPPATAAVAPAAAHAMPAHKEKEAELPVMLGRLRTRSVNLDGKRLLSDTAALVVRLRSPPELGGLALRDNTWLGFRVPSSFRGKELLEWLRQRCECSASEALAVGQQLREQGFIRHTKAGLGFSAGCYFFWRPDDVINALLVRLEQDGVLQARTPRAGETK